MRSLYSIEAFVLSVRLHTILVGKLNLLFVLTFLVFFSFIKINNIFIVHWVSVKYFLKTLF